MSRRAALITQADVARVARVAQSLGPEWYVEIRPDGVIRLMQGPAPANANDPDDRPNPLVRGLTGVM